MDVLLSPGGVALIGVLALTALLIIRVPVGIAMMIVGFVGILIETDTEAALGVLQLSTISSSTDELFGIVPMFILMGTFANASGISRDLFAASNAMFGHLKGGLAIGSMMACAGFAAVSGSSVASAATMGRIALPEMKRFGYDPAFSSATIAAGGTLGILIPPSVVLALYGILTETDIAELFLAGFLPGLLALVFYILAILFVSFNSKQTSGTPGQFSLKALLHSLRGVWTTLLLFMFVIGGIYVGLFTPTEAAAMGAGGVLIVGLLQGRLNRRSISESLVGASRTTGSVFLTVIGAVVFSRFLALTGAPQELSAFISGLQMGPLPILLVILLVYLLLGAFLDALAVIVLTVPIMHPLIMELGYSPIWFGIILVMVVELGLITPPYGMNVFVIKSTDPNTPIGSIYKALIPFMISAIARIVLLIAFPVIALYLPSVLSG